MPHVLLIAKLEAYGLDKPSLNLANDYLSFQKQKTKIGFLYSANFTRDIPRGSVPGSILFNNFINDIFLFIEKSDTCNFADDNTLFSCGDNLPVILGSLEYDMKSF